MLPRAIQQTQGVALQVVDYAFWDDNGVAGSSGTVTLTADPIDSLQLWRVERIVVQVNSTNQTTCTVYGGNGTPIAIQARDWTPIPAGFVAVAEYPQPMTILGATSMTIQVTGCTAGDTVTTSVQYALVQRVPAGSS
jgi:hypothetical protein